MKRKKIPLQALARKESNGEYHTFSQIIGTMELKPIPKDVIREASHEETSSRAW